ncbi:MAG: Glycerol-1-phosphate dehydrogenase [NAD(P)+] [Candidatus Thorarchaeota archaeon]|nr:MAG: Glycerol-1-phosphate dehydrogenase [NAD(P)+] [Candidatus Thorarchaeota archaeon]
MSDTDPRIVIIERGALGKLCDILNEYNHPVCVSDNVIHERYQQHLEDVTGTCPAWIMAPNNSTDQVPEKADIIVGFGGGRSLDTAKLFARDYDIDWISVPTAASHDGIASDVASVSHNGYRYSEKCKSPIAVVADIDIIEQAPDILRKAGTGDIICKISSLAEWRLAHEHNGENLQEPVFEMVESALNEVLKNDSLETLILAEINSGKAMNIAQSSRPCSGTEHAISHAMDRRCQNLHGIQVAFTTPLCVYFLKQTGYTEYPPKKIQKFMIERKMPVTLAEMNMSRKLFLDDIHHALKIMKKRNRYSVFEHLDAKDDDILRACKNLNY